MNFSLFKGAGLTEESVKFQTNHKLAIDMKAEVARLNKLNVRKDKDYTKLGTIITKTTGMQVRVRAMADLNAMVSIPLIDANHPLLANFPAWLLNVDESAGTISDVIAKTGELTSSIDLVNLKVSGVFSKLAPEDIWVGEKFFDNDYTVEEITAIILHEVGHLFYYFVSAARASSSLFLVEEASKRLLKQTDVEIKTTMLTEFEDSTGTKLHDKILLNGSKDGVVVRTALMAAAVEGIQSELGYNPLISTDFEQLADAFAVRLGYGRPLATALAKLTKAGVNKNRAIIITAELLLGSALAVMTLANPLTGATYGAFWLGLYIAGETADDVYDKPQDRLRRMRTELTGALKARNLSKEVRAIYLSDLDSIERAEKLVKNNPFISGGLLTAKLIALLLPSTHTKMKLKKYQQVLEQLANNELFRASAEVDQLLGE